MSEDTLSFVRHNLFYEYAYTHYSENPKKMRYGFMLMKNSEVIKHQRCHRVTSAEEHTDYFQQFFDARLKRQVSYT